MSKNLVEENKKVEKTQEQISMHRQKMSLIVELYDVVMKAIGNFVPPFDVHINEDTEQLEVVLAQPEIITGEMLKTVDAALVQFDAVYVNLKKQKKTYFAIQPQIVKKKPEKTEAPVTVEETNSAPKITTSEVIRNMSPLKLFQESYCQSCEKQKDCDNIQRQNCIAVLLLTQVKEYNKMFVEQMKTFLEKLVFPTQTVQATTTEYAMRQQPKTVPTQNVTNNKSVEDVRMMFPEVLDNMLSFEEKSDYIIIKPKQFLGSKNFAEVAKICKNNNGEYISAGRESHFKICKTPTTARPQETGYRSQQSTPTPPTYQYPSSFARPDVHEGTENDNIEVGKAYVIEGMNAVGAKGLKSKFYLIKVADQISDSAYQTYIKLYNDIKDENSKAVFANKMFHWILNNGSGDIGVKHQKPKLR